MNQPDLERSLQRALKRNNLSTDKLPSAVEDWHQFLSMIDTSLISNRQARSQIEHALETSSKEMRALNEDLSKESEERVKAIQESEDKSRFMANMSHEIRTPIHGIMGSLEILNDEVEISTKQQSFINAAYSSAENLLDLVNSILDFSKIGANQLELEHIPFDIYQLLEDSVSIGAAAAQKKKLEINTHVSNSIPRFFYGDPTKLRQITTNLLGNAIKFTEEGSITVKVEHIRAQGEQHGLRINVIDTGIGIPNAMQKNIFNPFTQEDATTTRRYGGTGLGLTIVKELATLMNATVGVTSIKGEGSTFYIDITLPEAGEYAKTAALEADQSPDLGGLHVLVVDDVDTNLSILNTYLKSWDVRVESASSASQALEMIDEKSALRGKHKHDKSKQFDIILIDYRMPTTNGLDLAKAIRNLPHYDETAIVMLSSDDLSIEQQEASMLTHCINKPVRKKILKEIMERCRHDTLRQHEIRNNNAAKTQQNTDASTNENDKARLLLAEDNPTNALIALTMLKQTGFNVEHVENGQLAVEALKSKSFSLVLMDMHMPVMDGYEATKLIREWEKQSGAEETPIIALTANALIGDKEKCLSIGMDDYLPKPVSKQSLDQMVTRWVNKKARPVSVSE